ncbi:MAG: leucine-rich repeat domain-containing protein [Firmicutes bacterium]|nr:leucine-rich repeat domain-containing protein [Bacillota bacterium]
MNKFEKTKGEGKSMQNKQNTKAKVIVIAIAILLCLALAVGITGAWYQAQRRATGTVKMDKGIVIDYTGFGKEADGIWVRENETSFRLFSDTDVQPGEKISLNDAGIKANASSVDFYARVKLSYEFYDGETKLETLPASFKASDLITTSATFFGADWVKSSDGYHYYGVDTTLNKFTKAAPAGFVDLFDSNAKFIIEGAGFTGAENEGEGGGYVVDETTSINKIVVYLTLETLQGDVSAEELNTMGWKINVSSMVDFSKIESENARIETSVGKVETTENLNVSVGGAAEVPLNEVVFPYDTPTILEFDSKNVEYVELTYSSGEKETFLELPASEESATKYSQIAVTANSSKGTVTAYTVGYFGDMSEYKDLIYSTSTFITENDMPKEYPISDGVAVIGYYGEDTNIIIKNKINLRTREVVIKRTITDDSSFYSLYSGKTIYPCVAKFTASDGSSLETQLNSFQELLNSEWKKKVDEKIEAGLSVVCESKFTALCKATIGKSYKVKAIGLMAFMGNDSITSVDIPEGVSFIGGLAFDACPNITKIILPSTIEIIGEQAFGVYDQNLTTLTLKSTIPPKTLGDSDTIHLADSITKIYIPTGTLTAYQSSSVWSEYSNLFEEKDFS